MLRCLRLCGTSRADFIWSLLVEGKKSFMTIKCVLLFFSPVNLVYRCCRMFICEWKWLWRRHALLYPNNNTYFFHSVVFMAHGEAASGKSTRSFLETLRFKYMHVCYWLKPASQKKFKFYLLGNGRSKTTSNVLIVCHFTLNKCCHHEASAKLEWAAKPYTLYATKFIEN